MAKDKVYKTPVKGLRKGKMKAEEDEPLPGEEVRYDFGPNTEELL